jgi:hypothetical protein
MNHWMIGYVEGKRQALEVAAQHFEQNIKGRFNPQQVAVILRALADVDEKISPDPINPQGKIFEAYKNK